MIKPEDLNDPSHNIRLLILYKTLLTKELSSKGKRTHPPLLDGGYMIDATNWGIYECPFTSLRYTFILYINCPVLIRSHRLSRRSVKYTLLTSSLSPRWLSKMVRLPFSHLMFEVVTLICHPPFCLTRFGLLCL